METPLRIRDALAQLAFVCDLEGWYIERSAEVRVTGQTDDGFMTREVTGEQSISIRPPA